MSLTVEYIDTIYNKFITLFKPDKPIGSKELNTILLYYSFYGMKRTPHYYDNWDFSSWRRLIRDLDSKENGFKLFFNDYDGTNLKDILDKKKNEFISKKTEIINSANSEIQSDSLIDTIRFYALIIKDLWVKGRFVAESHYLPTKTLTSYEDGAIFNTRGDFRGYGHEEYCTLVKRNHDNSLEYLKNRLKTLKK